MLYLALLGSISDATLARKHYYFFGYKPKENVAIVEQVKGVQVEFGFPQLPQLICQRCFRSIRARSPSCSSSNITDCDINRLSALEMKVDGPVENFDNFIEFATRYAQHRHPQFEACFMQLLGGR